MRGQGEASASVAGALTVTVMVTAMLALAGCAMGPTPSELAHQQARDHLTAATNAIQSADFESARRELQRARMRSPSAEVTAQVRSLEQLVNGADALHRGNVTEAKQYWGAIEDPILAREVHRRASEIGIEIAAPRAASASEVE